MKKSSLVLSLFFTSLITSLHADLTSKLIQLTNSLNFLIMQLQPIDTSQEAQLIDSWLRRAQNLRGRNDSEKLLREIIQANEMQDQLLFTEETNRKHDIELILDHIQDKAPILAGLVNYIDLLIEKNTDDFGKGYTKTINLEALKRNTERSLLQQRRSLPAHLTQTAPAGFPVYQKKPQSEETKIRRFSADPKASIELKRFVPRVNNLLTSQKQQEEGENLLQDLEFHAQQNPSMSTIDIATLNTMLDRIVEIVPVLVDKIKDLKK